VKNLGLSQKKADQVVKYKGKYEENWGGVKVPWLEMRLWEGDGVIVRKAHRQARAGTTNGN